MKMTALEQVIATDEFIAKHIKHQDGLTHIQLLKMRNGVDVPRNEITDEAYYILTVKLNRGSY